MRIEDAIRRAVSAIPITGDPELDYLLMLVTGKLESGYRHPLITPPNGESSALGYFQLINATRRTVAKRLKRPWTPDPYTQALFACYVYRELGNMLRRGSIPTFRFASDPIMNFILNLRFRYVAGTGTRYFGHRDSKAFLTKITPYLPYFQNQINKYYLTINSKHETRNTPNEPRVHGRV